MQPFSARWTRKPPPGTDLDRTHPYCPDFCWPILSPQGTNQLLVRNLHPGPPTVLSDVYAGSSSIQPGGKYGLSIRHGATTDLFILTNASGFTSDDIVGFGSAGAMGGFTMMAAYRKTDATLRASTLIGINGTLGGSSCMQTICPYSDGNVYFDFGGTTVGTTRVQYSGGTFGDDLWGFSTGPQGMQIWQNGLLRASNSANPSRTPANFYFGWPAGTPTFSDLADLAFIMIWKWQIPAEAIRALSLNPWQVFAPPQSVTLAFNPPPGAIPTPPVSATWTAPTAVLNVITTIATPADHATWTVPTAVLNVRTALATPATHATWTAVTPTMTAGTATIAAPATHALWTAVAPAVTGGAATITAPACHATWTAVAPAIAGGAVTLTTAATKATWHAIAPFISNGSVVSGDVYGTTMRTTGVGH